MKVDGIPFKNSETCKGSSFHSDASLDISTIEISGRYPESGWALNEIVREIVYVESGGGSLCFENGEMIQLEKGEVVALEPNKWFAWDGNMTLIMVCQPAFNQKQYRIKE